MERLTKRVDGIAVLESWAIDKDQVSIIQRLCNRLAAYEDSGLESEDVRRLQKDWTSLIITIDEMGGMPHLHDLLQAEKEARLVVLPFPQNKPLLDMSNPENPELLVNFSAAISYNQCGIVFHQPFNIFVENVERGYICQVSEEAEVALKGGEG